MLPTRAGGVALPACDSTRRALRLSEYAQRFISQPARLQQKAGGKVKPTAVQRASASSSPLNSALEKANMFSCSREMRMRRRQRCLPNTQSLARALHGPRHIPSLLVADADVVQGCSNVGVTRRQNPSSKLQRALLHRQRIFMSTEGTVCFCEVVHGAADIRMVGRQNPSVKRDAARM